MGGGRFSYCIDRHERLTGIELQFVRNFRVGGRLVGCFVLSQQQSWSCASVSGAYQKLWSNDGGAPVMKH